MRNFMRLDTPMLFFFACVVATQVSCSSDTTTNPGPPVAAVTVALDASMLTVGHTAQASATVKDSAGNAINGQTVSWASQDTGVAKVSADGAVTAVAAGSTVIQGKIAGKTGVAPLTVVGPPNLAFHDFNDGTRGPFSSFATATQQPDFPDDPTGSGRGKVARIYYAPTLANRSAEGYVNWRAHDVGKIRYGRTIWFKGEFFLPTNPLSDPNWRASDDRKILDWQGQSDDGYTLGGARWFINRSLDYNIANTYDVSLLVEARTTVNGVDQGATVAYFAQFARNQVTYDTWHTLEVRMITNSADGVHDGSIAFWLDNRTAMPTFETPHTLYFINEAWAPNGLGGVPVVGSYFNDLRQGSQLTNLSPLALNTEYRYWDNIAFSTTRIGN